jgi:hypothetical protein
MELQHSRSLTLDLDKLNKATSSKATSSKTFKLTLFTLATILALYYYPTVRKHTYTHKAKQREGVANCVGGGFTHVIYAFVPTPKDKASLKSCRDEFFLTYSLSNPTQSCSNQGDELKSGYQFTNYNFLAKPEQPIKIELFNYRYSKEKPEQEITLTTDDYIAVSWNKPKYDPEQYEYGKICWNGKCFEWKSNTSATIFQQLCGYVQKHCIIYKEAYGGEALAYEDCNRLPSTGNLIKEAPVGNILIADVEKYEPILGKPMVSKENQN